MANSSNQIIPAIPRLENNSVIAQVFSEALRHGPTILNASVKHKNRGQSVNSSLADSQWMAELPACWHWEFWWGRKFKLSSEPFLEPTCISKSRARWHLSPGWALVAWLLSQGCLAGFSVPCLWTPGARPAAHGAAPAAPGAPSPGGRSAPRTGTSGRSSAPPAPSSAPPGSCSSASTPHFPLWAAP